MRCSFHYLPQLGARIAEARKDHGMTQQELADELGVAQQKLAHYEVGRARIAASMLPIVARLLTLSLDELMGQPVAARAVRGRKRGSASRLQQQIDAVGKLCRFHWFMLCVRVSGHRSQMHYHGIAIVAPRAAVERIGGLRGLI